MPNSRARMLAPPMLAIMHGGSRKASKARNLAAFLNLAGLISMRGLMSLHLLHKQ
jgi:hypothetical protein